MSIHNQGNIMNEDSIKLTSDHYSKQWGAELNFKDFVKDNPNAARVMPARQLPWQELFNTIRLKAKNEHVRVYDAGCGFGDVMNSLTIAPNPSGLEYVGADIHCALNTIKCPSNARLIQSDITKPLPNSGKFDYIICRAAIHHTPEPATTYKVLVSQLSLGGTIAITAYAKKALMREAVDDALRGQIVPLSNENAFIIANQFTRLGHDLQTAGGSITITADLPFLGIKAGTYTVQSFIYQHFIKCWYNTEFSEKHCDLVNFDWYHPPHAYRYSMDELCSWATSNDLIIICTESTEAQHYLEAKQQQ